MFSLMHPGAASFAWENAASWAPGPRHLPSMTFCLCTHRLGSKLQALAYGSWSDLIWRKGGDKGDVLNQTQTWCLGEIQPQHAAEEALAFTDRLRDALWPLADTVTEATTPHSLPGPHEGGTYRSTSATAAGSPSHPNTGHGHVQTQHD